jgi:hypothetical protein
VSWDKVNVFAYFPSLFAIYLLFISSLAKGYLTKQVTHATTRGAIPTAQANFVRNLAAGWSAQLGFFSSTLSACFSAFSIFSSAENFKGAGLTVIVLLFIFAGMFWYVVSHEPDEMEANTGLWGWSPAKVCRYVLLAVNVVLLVAVTVNQQLASAPAPK